MPSDFDVNGTVDSRHAFDLARETDCEVLVADAYTLQLDLDSDEDYVTFVNQLEKLKHFMAVGDVEELKSRGGNRHILVKLTKRLAVRDRILLQACLGSDPVRELLSYRRVLADDPNPVLLLRPKPKLLTAGTSPKALLGVSDELKNILSEMEIEV